MDWESISLTQSLLMKEKDEQPLRADIYIGDIVGMSAPSVVPWMTPSWSCSGHMGGKGSHPDNPGRSSSGPMQTS